MTRARQRKPEGTRGTARQGGDSLQDRLIQETWSRRSAQRWLDHIQGFTDPGDRAAYEQVFAEVRGRPILDLGVGTGRTVPLYRPIASEYVAVDCVPAMVRACKESYPEARVELNDARYLVGLPEAHFKLVHFSFNGIDAVSRAGRSQVLSAVSRVLSPDGVFSFSTLNRDGPSYRERPWRLRVWSTRNPLRYAWRAASQFVTAPYDLARWLRIRHATEVGDGYAVAPMSAHPYGVVAHYTTLDRELDELEEAGFERDALVYDSVAGTRVRPGDDTRAVDWFHVIARLRTGAASRPPTVD